MLRTMNPWAILRQLFREAGHVVRARWRVLTFALLGVVVGVVLLIPHDRSWNEWLVNGRTEPWISLARQFSYWGDIHTGTAIICGAIWLFGWWQRRPQWRAAALAAMLAASCAGVEVVSLRFLLGRPRPRARVADSLRGPSFNSDWASFPSGHAATAFGTAGALLGTMPMVGIPVLAGAGGVVWSRLYNNAHYPSDVWAGACIGWLHGLVFAAAARRVARPIAQS